MAAPNSPTTTITMSSNKTVVLHFRTIPQYAITILAPILVPVAMTFNIDLVFFGVLMVVNMAIGCITPPVGVDLFVATTISGVPIEKIAKAIFPFLVVLIVDLILITYVQDIIMWLPRMFGG